MSWSQRAGRDGSFQRGLFQYLWRKCGRHHDSVQTDGDNEMTEIEERLEHYQRLDLAGIRTPDLDFGPAVILWTRRWDGTETWEVLPKYVADLVISELHNSSNVERAAVYHRIPKDAPMDVAKAWLYARLTRRAKCGTI